MIKTRQMSSIKSKLITVIISIIISITVITLFISSFLNYQNTTETLESTMMETVKIAAGKIQSEIDGYKRLIYALSQNPIIADTTKSSEERFAELKRSAEIQGFTQYGLTDENGFTSENGKDLSQTTYFKYCKENGRTYISDPVILDESNAIVIMAAPITIDKQFKGIVFFCKDAGFLSESVANIKIGKSGTAIILNKTGNIIAAEEYQVVLSQYNMQKEAENNKKLEELVKIQQDMTKGNENFGSYTENGKGKYMAYTPITNSDGWSIGVSVVKSEFTTKMMNSILFNILVSLVILIIAIIVSIRMASRIADAIKKCSQRLVLLSEGDLHTEVPELNTKDETKILRDAMQVTIENLSMNINDVAYHLGKMAEGNMDTKVTKSYIGDFQPLEHSMKTIIASLNNSMKKIGENAEQVAQGSKRVSDGAQTLLQGAVEQAGSVEELVATISEVTNQISNNAESAKRVSEKTSEVGKDMEKSNQQMKLMVQAMADISNSSNEIKKIIDTIEDIADQTNLLSLNASIEAARAGDAGKGFAVVANEVGTLAGESAKASQDSRELIKKSLEAVERGIKIANETAHMLDISVSEANEVADIVEKIYEASDKQQEAVSQISVGIGQIADIVQENSNMAEISANSSEELSLLSQDLKDLVNNFKLGTEL